MDIQGVIIWARAQSLIIWCGDGGALAYVADRRIAGDPHAVLAVGDLVDLHVQTIGAMRVGTALSYRATGASAAVCDVKRAGERRLGPVMSGRSSALNRAVARGADAAAVARRRPPANRRRDSGAA